MKEGIIILLTKIVIVKWCSGTKKYYQSKGYTYTKMGDEFEVKVEDLSKGSHIKVEVQCDKCNKILNAMQWKNYILNVHEDGKYYCNHCAIQLFGVKKSQETKLKNSESFYDWCYRNLSKEQADEIMLKWDYELNNCSPMDVTYSSMGKNKKGYYFKCLIHPEHKSELHSISDLTSCIKKYHNSNQLDCDKCNSFAQWGYDNISNDFLNLYWDWQKNDELGINPWEISHASHKKVWIFCQEKSYHGSYDISCDNFINKYRCPWCSNNHGKVYRFDSLGWLYPEVFKYWSEKNKTSPYDYSPMSTQKIYWKCINNKHKDYLRGISESNILNFRCPECSNENNRGENIWNWKGGISSLIHYLRGKIIKWKKDTMRKCNFKCVITGKRFDVIHHLYGFDQIFEETIKITNLPIYKEVNKYTKEELKLLEDTCINLHSKYGLGVCLCNEMHNLFHKIYGYGNNTPEQFKEFTNTITNKNRSHILKINKII